MVAAGGNVDRPRLYFSPLQNLRILDPILLDFERMVVITFEGVGKGFRKPYAREY